MADGEFGKLTVEHLLHKVYVAFTSANMDLPAMAGRSVQSKQASSIAWWCIGSTVRAGLCSISS